jgi:H+-translocating NAD(P) transhydrogenase subunit alpha
MLSANMTAVVKLLLHDGNISLNLEDEIIRESLVTHQGKVIHPRVAELLSTSQLSGEVKQ